MAQFRLGLHGPVGALLPDDLQIGAFGAVELLDSDGQLADEARDLCVEYAMPKAALDGHWSWARVSAELEERRIYEKLRRFPEKEHRVLLEVRRRLPAECTAVSEPVGRIRVD